MEVGEAAPPATPSGATPACRNRFDRAELAGAFGDFGTLIPFVVAYISMLGLDPFGVLLSFGLSMIAVGWVYKTPFSVQPMKAIGAVDTTQAAQTATITAGAVHGACLVTRAIWLVLGLTGAAKRVAGIVSTPVAIGIVLGLGLSFMLDGAKLMAAGWWLSGAALLGTLALLTNRRVSVMFLLLAGGAAIALFRDLAAGRGRTNRDRAAPAHIRAQVDHLVRTRNRLAIPGSAAGAGLLPIGDV